jgi:hypothetical protein
MAAVAIAAGAMLAFVVPSSADVSVDSPSVAAVIIQSPATLEARGAAVTVQVTAVCTPGAYAYLYVNVTQRVGGDIANGSGSADIPVCTGGAQTFGVVVAANGSPFRKGTAFGSADLYVSSYPSGHAEDQRDIEIVRP